MEIQNTIYAGFWRRALAVLLDTLVLWIPVSVFHWLVDESQWNVWVLVSVAWFQSLVIWTLYYGFLESSKLQGTLGKMVLGLKVTDMNGGRISFPRACGRYLAQMISLVPVGIGFMMAGWTQRKQALHDMICSCLVVRKTGPATQPPTISAPH